MQIPNYDCQETNYPIRNNGKGATKGILRKNAPHFPSIKLSAFSMGR